MRKLIALACSLALIGGSAAAENAGKEPIKIGDITAYTKLALNAEAYKKGVDLAVQEINAKGGIEGRPLQIVSRDSKMDPSEAVKFAQEVVTREHATVLMDCEASGVTLAISNWTKQNKIPLIAACSEADSIFWENGHDYVFSTDWNGYMWMTATMQKAVELYGEKIKHKRWAIIAPNLEFGKSLVATAKRYAQEHNLDATWVAEQWPAYDRLEPGASIMAISHAKPDVIISLLWGNDVAKFVREGKKRNLFEGKIIISPPVGIPEHLDMLKSETPIGWISVGFPSDDIKDPKYVKFKQAYETTYKEAPKTYSVSGYNAIYAIAAALNKAKSDKPAKIRDALEKVSFHTPLGEQHFRKVDHLATSVFWVGVTGVQNGKGKLLDWRAEKAEDNLPPDAWILEKRAKAQKGTKSE